MRGKKKYFTEEERKQAANEAKKRYLAAHREEYLAKQRAYQAARKEEKKAYKKQYGIKLKQQVIDHYGGKCACCGESNLIFLAIDHRNGGGTQHRKTIKGQQFYRWLKEENYPPGYQVLCHNCNWANAWGVCPHKLNKTV